MLFKEQVTAIAGAAVEVHRELGPGFPEAFDQEAMEMELRGKAIPFEVRRPLRITGRLLPMSKFLRLVILR